MDLGTDFRGYIKRADVAVGGLLINNVNVELTGEQQLIAREQWHFRRMSDGSYIISSVYNLGWALTAEGGGTTNGTNVRTNGKWSDEDSSQRWFVYQNGSGYRLVPKCAPKLCLDCTGNQSTAGTNLQLYTQQAGPAQRFVIGKHTSVIPKGVGISASSVSMGVGESTALSAWVTPDSTTQNLSGIVWASSNGGVASVSSSGVVTGVAEGTATITASSRFNDKLKASCTVTVQNSDRTPPVVARAEVVEQTDERLVMEFDVQDETALDASAWLDGHRVEVSGGAEVTDCIVIAPLVGDEYKPGLEVLTAGEKFDRSIVSSDATSATVRLALDATDTFVGEDHRLTFRAWDSAGNQSEDAELYFHWAAAESAYAHMSVGDVKTSDELWASSAVGNRPSPCGWRYYAGNQSIVAITGEDVGESSPYAFEALAPGRTTVVFQNPKTGQLSYRVFVVAEADGSEPVLVPLPSATFGAAPNEDEMALEAVHAAIEALPAAASVALADQAQVEAARTLFDALTEAQIALLGYDGYAELETRLGAVEGALAELQNDDPEDTSAPMALRPNIADGEMTLAFTTKAYTGSPLQPSVSLSLAEDNGDGSFGEPVQLSEGVDYDVYYVNNVLPGTASVIVVGAGGYGGVKTGTFEITAVPLDGATVTLGYASVAYDGKAKTPKVTVKIGGKTLVAGTDYTVSYAKNKAVGTAKVTVQGCEGYTGSNSATFKIVKAANPLVAKGKAVSLKASAVKKATKTLAGAKVMSVSKAQGSVTYKKVSGNAKITVNKTTGKLTVKKGLKKGTYRVKVAVKAAGNVSYKAGSKNVTIKVVIK